MKNKPHTTMTRTKTYKTDQANMAAKIREDLKYIGVACRVKSYNGCVCVFGLDVDHHFTVEEGEKIVELGKFYGLTGVYGLELSTHGKEQSNFEMYL